MVSSQLWQVVSAAGVTHFSGLYSYDDVQIGGSWKNVYMLDGAFDDVMIFNRPLGAEEVSALFQHQR